MDKEDVFNNFSSPDLQFLDFENKIKNKNINKGYFLKIFNNFVKKNSIDEMISSNLNGEWKIDRLPTVITAILSVAISEMSLFPKISINIIVSEYLEIAESFHKIEEIKFINPILDKIKEFKVNDHELNAIKNSFSL